MKKLFKRKPTPRPRPQQPYLSEYSDFPRPADSVPLLQLLACPVDSRCRPSTCTHTGPADPARPSSRTDLYDPPFTIPAADTATAEQQPTPAARPAVETVAAGPVVEEDRPAEWRPMTGWQKFFGFILAPPALALGGLGFVVSFETVVARMTTTFGERAWMVPIGVDIGILVFAGVHIWLAAIGMRMGWLRLVPWLLTAATILLNATSHLTDIATVGAHTVLPLLWVIVCEVIANIVAVRTGMRRGERPDPIPRMRWIIDPWNTLLLWRNMRLWGIRSYKLATALERERLLVRTRLREAFPSRRRRWTATVPPMLLTRYRLRELTLADVEAELAMRAAEDITAAAVRATPAVAVPAEPNTPTADPGPAAEAPADRPSVPAENRPAAPARPKTATRPTGQTPAADLAATFDRLAADLKRRPTGRELKDAAGCGLTKAKDWMKANRPIEGATT